MSGQNNDLKSAEFRKMKRDVEELEVKLAKLDNHPPVLINNQVFPRRLTGKGNCEMCNEITTYDIELKPNSEKHLYCPTCQEKVYEMVSECGHKIMILRNNNS